MSYPIYILELDKRTIVVSPERVDIGHYEWWEQAVHKIVADHFRVPARRLKYLHYCQKRARIVGNRVYYGGKHCPELLADIRRALGNEELHFVYDDHERRLRDDVREFRRAVKAPCR